LYNEDRVLSSKRRVFELIMKEQQKEIASPVKVFYSYAHEDERLRNRLEKHLSAMKQQGMISEWYNRGIVAGTDWARTSDEHLMEATVILLLISPDFLASDYCYGIEMRQALERHEANDACVIPILLRPVDWHGAPFAHLQFLPGNAKAVTEWSNHDAAFRDVAGGIRKAIEQLQSPRPVAPPITTSTISSPSQRDLRNRQRLLKRIYAFWVADVLEPSLLNAPPIVLELQERPDAVAKPWKTIIQIPDRSAQTLPPGTSITQVYDDADGELLILGAPGAGKTTLLLELARELIDRARRDENYPMPVVFNLSSWAVKRQPLDLWFIEELNTRYQIPHQLGQSWVDKEEVLPLLDGLDEGTPTAREECVKAINVHREKHSLLPTVVCCRSADFFALETPLHLYKAVAVQPLTAEQIDQYLSNAEESLVPVRQALQTDPVLRELATTPLMLSMLTVTSQEQSTADFPIDDAPQDRRHRLFASYVQSMLQRHGEDARYQPQKTMRWLSWLASQLFLRNQVVFSLERIQPDWLPPHHSHRFYNLLVKFTVGLVAGLIYALVFGIAYGLTYKPIIGLTEGLIFGSFYGLAYGLIYGLDDLLVGGLMIGLLVSLLGNLLVRLFVPRTSRSKPERDLNWSRKKVQRSLIVGSVYGVIYALLIWVAFGQLIYGLIGGVAAWLIYVLVARLSSPRTREIKPAEALTWSWRNMGGGLIRGLPYGLVIGLIFTLVTKMIYDGLVIGGTGVIVIAVITGLSGATLREQAYIKPNQGTWRSLRHAVLLTLGIGVIVGLVIDLIAGPYLGLLFGLFFGLLVGLQYGGIAFIQHAMLRFLLWRSKSMPLNYPRFLDYAAERILLRRVGGNYIFVHYLLLEYFASLHDVSDDKQTSG
jgi:hypothetical protein